MAEERGAFFDEFVQGGLLDDADVTIKSARFNTWDYNGKVPQPILSLKLEMEDGEGQTHEQQLSAGELRFFVPSSDGKRAVPVGNQQKLNMNTNAVAFIISLMNADTKGEMAAKLRGTDDVSVLDGLKCHVVRKAQPKRSGIIQQPAADGQNREKTQLTVEKIIAYPWGGNGGAAPATAGTATAAAPAAAPATAAAAGAAAGGEIADAAYSVLMQILAEAGGSIKKSAIAGKVFGNADMKSVPAPTRNAVLGLIVRDDFLAAQADKGIKYDAGAGTVSLG